MSSIVFQPYYHWKGHFKKYSDSLVNESDFLLKNSLEIKFKGFISYIFLRFFLYFVLLIKLREIVKFNKVKKVFFVEFEPLAILLNYLFIKKLDMAVFTIHSIAPSCYTSRFKNNITRLQRLLLFFVLKKISKNKNSFFIVHSEFHKTQLANILGCVDKIAVVEYPAPEPMIQPIPSFELRRKLLIFGAMREDKGIYDFLKEIRLYRDDFIKSKIDIFLVGKVSDYRIFDMSDLENVHIVNEFISEEKLLEYVNNSGFFLVPYYDKYTGGAGPLKDATSYGRPVICSNIELFREIRHKYNFSIIYCSIQDLINKIDSMNNAEYQELVKNAIDFSHNNNWLLIRDKYEHAISK